MNTDTFFRPLLGKRVVVYFTDTPHPVDGVLDAYLDAGAWEVLAIRLDGEMVIPWHAVLTVRPWSESDELAL